jgi:hypothetical protein
MRLCTYKLATLVSGGGKILSLSEKPICVFSSPLISRRVRELPPAGIATIAMAERKTASNDDWGIVILG